MDGADPFIPFSFVGGDSGWALYEGHALRHHYFPSYLPNLTTRNSKAPSGGLGSFLSSFT